MHSSPIALEQTQPLQRLRLIIVDDSREYMNLLRRMLAGSMPEIEVTEYDAEQQGKPGPDFDWSLYDVVLLDQHLGHGETGIEWLQEFIGKPRMPPTILMTAEGGDYLAARAIKLGAHDYIRKQDITIDRMTALISAAVGESRTLREQSATLPEPHVAPHIEILRRLAERLPNRSLSADGDTGYRFVRLIGQGASSRVYLAERTSDSATMVLKIIDAETIRDIQVVERFIREAEIVQSISSPYVVRFFDHGLTQNFGYIAMEFFTRGDLKQRLERGVLPEDALNYLQHIAYGLEAIHAKGIIHRDLKPGNIMFRADDSLALADFGISRRIDLASDLTNQECVLGTPNYLSPEQALGQVADQRSDLYSAGVVLYEMLAGRKPYRAESAAALIYQHVHAPLPSLPEEVREYQPLITRLLAKSADDRFQSASELVAALEHINAVTSG